MIDYQQSVDRGSSICVTRPCRLLEGPDTAYPTLCNLRRGTIVMVVRTAAPWVGVTCNGVEGWIPQDAIR